MKGKLPYEQGKNEYNRSGTCALADTGVWLKIAGSKNTENDVVGYATTHMDSYGEPLCDGEGGTYPERIATIWGAFGIPAHSDWSKNIESIAVAVEAGKAVSVAVNAGLLWEQDNLEGFNLNDPNNNAYGDGGANHCIGIMSCERSALGTVTHLYINDTGRSLPRDACRRISVPEFMKAFMVGRALATISEDPIW